MLAIFHYVVAGLAGLFSLFPLLYTTDRHDLHIRRKAWHRETGRRPAPRISWLDLHHNRLGVALDRTGNGDLYPDRRPIYCAPQTLLVCIRDGLHRMPVHSVRNNSRSVHDHCPFAGIGKAAIFTDRNARLNRI